MDTYDVRYVYSRLCQFWYPSFGTILELLNKAKFFSRAKQSYAGKSKKSHVRPSVRASKNKTLAKNAASETNTQTKLEQQSELATTDRSKSSSHPESEKAPKQLHVIGK